MKKKYLEQLLTEFYWKPAKSEEIINNLFLRLLKILFYKSEILLRRHARTN